MKIYKDMKKIQLISFQKILTNNLILYITVSICVNKYYVNIFPRKIFLIIKLIYKWVDLLIQQRNK